MKRFVWMFAGIVACASVAAAQTPDQTAQPPAAPPAAPAAADAGRTYVEINGGATFGTKVSGWIGGEVGFRLSDAFDVFGEGGQMLDNTTNALQNDAQQIAGYLGSATGQPSSYTAKQPITYFDGGMRYNMRLERMVPYIALGVGAARVSHDVHFFVNGTDVTGQLPSYGVALGTDLAGDVTKALVVIGIGTHVGFGERWFADIGYRYGRIFDTTPINTSRLLVGAGVTF